MPWPRSPSGPRLHRRAAAGRVVPGRFVVPGGAADHERGRGSAGRSLGAPVCGACGSACANHGYALVVGATPVATTPSGSDAYVEFLRTVLYATADGGRTWTRSGACRKPPSAARTWW